MNSLSEQIRVPAKHKDYNNYFLKQVKIAVFWFMQLTLWQFLCPNSEDRQPTANQHHWISLKNTSLSAYFNLFLKENVTEWADHSLMTHALAGAVLWKISAAFPSNQQTKLSSKAGQVLSYILVASLFHLRNPKELQTLFAWLSRVCKYLLSLTWYKILKDTGWSSFGVCLLFKCHHLLLDEISVQSLLII